MQTPEHGSKLGLEMSRISDSQRSSAPTQIRPSSTADPCIFAPQTIWPLERLSRTHRPLRTPPLPSFSIGNRRNALSRANWDPSRVTRETETLIRPLGAVGRQRARKSIAPALGASHTLPAKQDGRGEAVSFFSGVEPRTSSRNASASLPRRPSSDASARTPIASATTSTIKVRLQTSDKTYPQSLDRANWI